MKNLLLPFMFLCSLSVGAQDLLSYIPADVNFLFTWNAAQVNKKVNTRQLMQQESFDLVFQEMVKGLDSLQQEEYYRLMTDPAAFGINSGQSIHIFGQNDFSGNYYALILPLSNAALLENFVAGQATVMDELIIIEDFGSYKMARLDGYYLGWNTHTAIIARGTPIGLDYGVDFYPEEEYYEEDYELDIIEEEAPAEEIIEEEAFEEEPAEWYDVEEIDIVASWLEGLLNRSFGPSMRDNTDYVKVTTKAVDAHLWVDYQQFLSMGQGGMGGGLASMVPTNEFLGSMYDGVHLFLSMNFNPGALDIRTQMVGKGKIVELMQKAYKAKFNKRMLRYVDSRDLLGYYTIRFNVKALAEGVKDIVYETMEEVPIYGENISRAMEVLGIMIDEDAIYELFKGDMMVAMTGIRRVDIPVTTYEYDENFNASQVERTITKEYPEFVFMASYGNEENVRKLIRLAESFEVARSMGDYFQLYPGGEGEEYLMAMDKGLLIVTNDRALIEEGLEKGARLSKKHRKNLCKNVQAMYWDVAATWVAMEGESDEPDDAMTTALGKMKDQVESVSLLTSRKVKPSVHSAMTLQLTDKDANALKQAIDILNQLILEAAGLARI